LGCNQVGNGYYADEGEISPEAGLPQRYKVLPIHGAVVADFLVFIFAGLYNGLPPVNSP
jgi:hypothetical protein